MTFNDEIQSQTNAYIYTTQLSLLSIHEHTDHIMKS